ncbi:piwi domain-containing protein [Ditylenchus destructor]|uniref:Piwi domain-containing protein n=1 Tax=Ditylenchus destructor TaxID=166010 RepID=A0AAD4MJA9_9BILA|nr:piwi domain-containing protein [Ditylenchus destructor]
MASGNPENPGFGQVTDHASPLGSGRVIHESLRLGELSRLVPVSPGTSAISGIYGFRKSGKSWMTKGAAMRRSRWVVLWTLKQKFKEIVDQVDERVTSKVRFAMELDAEASLAAMSVNEKPASELRYLTNLERQAEKTIKDAGGEVGKTVMPTRKRDIESDAQNREKLTTNVYGIAMKDNVLVYRFQVAINVFITRQGGMEASIDLLTKPTKDAILIERRDLRRDIFREFQNMADCPLSGSRCVYYDLESILFSLDPVALSKPDKNGFNADDIAIFENESAYLAIGCQKSVHFIEGPGNRDNACSASLVIQTTKTPFHMDGSLYEKAIKIIPKLRNIREDDRIKLEKVLKGLVLETHHGEKRQIFTIDGISKDTARTKHIPVNDHSISIEQYFKQNYGYVLSEPNIPLIEVGRSKDNIRYFPMEICNVADNQRVKVHEISPKMAQVIIRKSAVPPATLLEQNAKTAESLNLWNNNSLSLAGISVTKRPVDLNGRVLTPPKIRFQNGAINARPSDCTWQGSKFINPCKIGRWAAFAFLDERDKSRLRMHDFEEFLKRFVDESRLRGLQIEPRSFMPNILDNKTSEIEKTFAAALNQGVLYILAIHPDGAAGDLPHADIKYFERQYGIVTQCVALPTMLNVVQRNQRLTLQNIEPNRNENINVVSDIVTSCAEMFKKRRGHLPKRVIIYRGGCSDGEFQRILKYEIPLIKLALYAMECEPTITVLAVNKLQNIRFFKQDPGTVVDHTVTHPLFAEFYLNSHRAIQGTARTPKYTVLHDDNNMNMSQLEEMSFLLCFSHQIVFLPTSVPSPVYIADCYAKRGRALYQRWAARKGEQGDYKQLTNALCYASGKVFPGEFYGVRVNA